MLSVVIYNCIFYLILLIYVLPPGIVEIFLNQLAALSDALARFKRVFRRVCDIIQQFFYRAGRNVSPRVG